MRRNYLSGLTLPFVKELYVTSTKRQKMAISRSIVDAVRSMNPPGRFLERCIDSGQWNDIGDRKATEKTSQALRDGAAELRKQLSEDLGDPDFMSAVFEMESSNTDDSLNNYNANNISGKDNVNNVKATKPTSKPKTVKKGHRRINSMPDRIFSKKMERSLGSSGCLNTLANSPSPPPLTTHNSSTMPFGESPFIMGEPIPFNPNTSYHESYHYDDIPYHKPGHRRRHTSHHPLHSNLLPPLPPPPVTAARHAAHSPTLWGGNWNPPVPISCGLPPAQIMSPSMFQQYANPDYFEMNQQTQPLHGPYVRTSPSPTLDGISEHQDETAPPTSSLHAEARNIQSPTLWSNRAESTDTTTALLSSPLFFASPEMDPFMDDSEPLPLDCVNQEALMEISDDILRLPLSAIDPIDEISKAPPTRV